MERTKIQDLAAPERPGATTMNEPPTYSNATTDGETDDACLERMRKPLSHPEIEKRLGRFSDVGRPEYFDFEPPPPFEDFDDIFGVDELSWNDETPWSESHQREMASPPAESPEEREARLAQLRKDAVRCARKLEEFRQTPPPQGRLLCSEEDLRWLTPEERDLVEWFDRNEYAVFLRLSELYEGTGWIIPYCRYCCVRFNLGITMQYYLEVPCEIDYVLDQMAADAEKGNGRALNSLGILYEHGYRPSRPGLEDKAIKKDPAKAREYFAKSAEAGCFSGMTNLARALNQGFGGEVDKEGALRTYRTLAERGGGQARYAVACLLLENQDDPSAKKEEAARWLRLAADVGEPQALAVLAAAGDDASPERLVAELFISWGWQKAQTILKYDSNVSSSARYIPTEEDKKQARDRKWLSEQQADGAVVPAAASRETVRTPNLNSANPSFAARLILFVRDRFDGDAPAIYKAARLSRKTYSAIVSNELRPVSKQTAVALALALRLDISEASQFIGAAGFAFSTFLLEDIVVSSCIRAGIHDIGRVSEILSAHGAKPFSSDVPGGNTAAAVPEA